MGTVKGKTQVNLLLRDETVSLLDELVKQEATGIPVPRSDYLEWLIEKEAGERGIKKRPRK